MRKRNKPILLATLLIVLVGGAVGMNVMMLPKPNVDEQADQHQEEAALDASRKEDNASKAKSAADAMGASMSASKKLLPAEAASRLPGNSILRPRSSANKQTPNASMTSQQWYTKDYGYKGEKK
jgi:hypothetical protein